MRSLAGRQLVRAGFLVLALWTMARGADPVLPEPSDSPDAPPSVIKRSEPIYPYKVAKAGLNAKVLVEFVVNTEGDVTNPHVVRSNNPWFERSALDAILRWKFEPGRKGGRLVRVRVRQMIVFNSLAYPGGRELWSVPPRNKHSDKHPELQWTKAPEPIGTAFPVYPWEDFEAGRDGKTNLRFVVGPSGRVVAAEVIEATTPAMAQAVLAMIDMWEFTPPRKADGTPCFARLSIQHDFRCSGMGDVPVTDGARKILRMMEKSPDKIVLAAALDEPPKPLSRRPPVYPSTRRADAQPGSAEIEFIVDEEGDAQLPRIIASSEPVFGYAAVQAVATWRFTPPRRAGKAVATRVRVPMEFTAKETPPRKIPDAAGEAER